MYSCLYPYKADHGALVSCGRCPLCKKRRASSWAFRCAQHMKVQDSAHFITLTYANEYLVRSSNGLPTLFKRDLQSFFKRLRKSHDKKLSYYAIGEYGGRRARPHYHVLLFNADITKVVEAWSFGHVHCGDVTKKSVGYCVGYINKAKKFVPKDDDRDKEFQVMSKGIGINYLTPAMVKWHTDEIEDRAYVLHEDGYKIPMPRYYRDKIYYPDERVRLAEAGIERAKQKESEKWYELQCQDKDPAEWYNEYCQSVWDKFHKREKKRTDNFDNIDVAEVLDINQHKINNHENEAKQTLLGRRNGELGAKFPRSKKHVKRKKLSEKLRAKQFAIYDHARSVVVCSGDIEALCERLARLGITKRSVFRRARERAAGWT